MYGRKLQSEMHCCLLRQSGGGRFLSYLGNWHKWKCDVFGDGISSQDVYFRHTATSEEHNVGAISIWCGYLARLFGEVKLIAVSSRGRQTTSAARVDYVITSWCCGVTQ
jgi:hypothetical protein